MDNLNAYQTYLLELRGLNVAGPWLNTQHHTPWHSWKVIPQCLNLPRNFKMKPLLEAVGNRKICINTDKDILHWGYSTTCNLTINESYQIQYNFHNQEKYHIWHIIWKTRLWPKVFIFLWLLV